MAKTTGPFLSEEASGSFAKIITAGKWKSRSYMRHHVRPTNPQGTAQQANRQLMADAIIAWRALTNEEKEAQRLLGAQLSPPIPGYNYFLQQYILSPPEPIIYYPVGAECKLYHAYWDGTALDHSSFSNNGALQGNAAFTTNGILLDGINSFVNVPMADSLKIGTSDFTIAAWFNLTAHTQSSHFSLHHSADAIPQIYAGRSTASVFLGAYYDNLWNGGQTFDAGIVSLDNWHCLILSTDRDVGTIYSKDGGAPVGPSGATLAYDFQTYNQCTIGKRWLSYYFTGIIGEVLFLSGLWDAAKMANYFNSTKTRYGL